MGQGDKCLVYIGYMAKMAAMPIYGKKPIKTLLRDHKVYDIDVM